MNIMKKDLLSSLTDGHKPVIEDMTRANNGGRRKTESLSGSDTNINNNRRPYIPNNNVKDGCGCHDAHGLPPNFNTDPRLYANENPHNNPPNNVTMNK